MSTLTAPLQAKAAATVATYRKMKEPAFPGQIRIVHRKTLYMGEMPATDSELWQKRVNEYWALQAKTYGLVFTDRYTLDFDEVDGDLIMTTSARVERVLPGERI